MKCRLLVDLKGVITPDHPDGTYPIGTILDFSTLPADMHNPAVRLVRLGVAEPADEECEKMCGMSQEMRLRVQYAYQRVHRGIHPDDYEDYDAGRMIGYNPDGSPIPGPNAEQEADEEESESQLWVPEDYNE